MTLHCFTAEFQLFSRLCTSSGPFEIKEWGEFLFKFHAKDTMKDVSQGQNWANHLLKWCYLEETDIVHTKGCSSGNCKQGLLHSNKWPKLPFSWWNQSGSHWHQRENRQSRIKIHANKTNNFHTCRGTSGRQHGAFRETNFWAPHSANKSNNSV